jgi:hypothetical protein
MVATGLSRTNRIWPLTCHFTAKIAEGGAGNRTRVEGFAADPRDPIKTWSEALYQGQKLTRGPRGTIFGDRGGLFGLGGNHDV